MTRVTVRYGRTGWLSLLAALTLRFAPLAAQTPDSTTTGPSLVVDTVRYTSTGVTGIAGATVHTDGSAFVVLRAGAVLRIATDGSARELARLDSVQLPVGFPVPVTTDGRRVYVFDIGGPAVVEVDVRSGRVARRLLRPAVRSVAGLAAIGRSLLVAGYLADAPTRPIHEFRLPDLSYLRSFGDARPFTTETGREQFTGGTLNTSPDGRLLFGELNPPRLIVFEMGARTPTVCTPGTPFDDAERSAIQTSGAAQRITNVFPMSRGAGLLPNGYLVLSVFDIAARRTRLLFFDRSCRFIRERSVVADFWIIGSDRRLNLYSVRTYGDQDVVRYRLQP